MKAALEQRFRHVKDYLYGGGKGDEIVECYHYKAVTTRQSHACFSPYHKDADGKFSSQQYPAGTLMIVESAKFDGDFRSCYTCEPCISKAEEELR